MRKINGQDANTPEEKRKAVESMGGTYIELHEGDYIEVKGKKARSEDESQLQEKRNYVEKLHGKFIKGNVYE